jgi:AcrR family transcriptional regulator
MQSRSEETRLHILDSANQLFSQSGYDATSVADICQTAGVSKGAFYHHFPSKQALFMELLEKWLNRLDEGLNSLWRESKDFPQAVVEMAGMVGSILDKTDVRLSIFLEFWMQAQRDPAVWEAAIAPYRRYQRYFASLIQEGIDQGKLQEIDPELGARVLVSLAVGLLMQALFEVHYVDWGEETRESVQLLMDGMVRRSE